MGTSVKPEPTALPGATPAAPAPTAAPSSAAPPATPPTPAPAPSTSQAELDRLKAVVQAQDEVIRANARELQKARNAPPAAPPPPKDPKDFFADPHKATADIVKTELANTIAPLQSMLERLVSKGTSTDALAKYRTQYPQFNWDNLSPTIQMLADQAQSRGVNVDEGVMNTLALSAMGLAASGQIAGGMREAGAPAPTAAPTLPAVVVTPPHLMPSAPPVPAPAPAGGPVEPLNEHEARLARERGWTAEQYRSWRDVSPDQVVNHRAPGEEAKK